MPSRRSHTKSRLGCLQCKKRRVKCDEKMPRCDSCAKHNIACRYTGSSVNRLLLSRTVYSDNQQSLDTEERSSSESSFFSPNSIYSQSHLSTGGSRLSTTSPSSLEPLDILSKMIGRNPQYTSDLYMRDLELMHHYSTQTYRTWSDVPETQEIWRIVVPKEALAHRFLMHGLLALSALHLVQINSDDRSPSQMMYVEIATRHHSLALSSFRPELNNITRVNCNALFAFSSILSVFAFASSQCTGIEHGMAPVEEILQAFSLLRGVYEILRTAWDWIENGQLGFLLRDEGRTTGDTLPAEARAALEYLDEVNNDNSESEAKETYCSTIRILREVFEDFYTRRQQVRSAMAWPITVPQEYIALLWSRQPMALVILAHYCVILRLLDRRWWLTGWSEKLVKEIYNSLDASWRPSIRWPVEAVGLAEKGKRL
ncbi:uncharacterized protein V1513DRAFT_460580 [Lipomyces chichibuensis]|uniref:uncharacterized protein n=1 Tax=Lipomyces chichibuensis TaxID=1546026 RepID=UPI003343C1A5